MRRPERWARLTVYAAGFLAVFAIAEVRIWSWSLRGIRPGSDRWMGAVNRLTRWWGDRLFGLTCRVLKARLIVRGAVPHGRFVVLANHQSTADVAILIANLAPLNCKFVAKRVLGRWKPAVSTALARGGGALISRRPDKADLDELRRMGSELERWRGSAVVFAEGTRSRDGRLRPYRGGAARVIAEASGLPLLPVAIDGTWRASDLRGFLQHMLGCRVCLTVGDPIPRERWSGRWDETLLEVSRWAAEAIESARREGLVEPPPDRAPGTPSSDGEERP